MTTFYIDPSTSINGTGSEASPFNSWSSVTWTAGNTYLQRAGTIAREQISVGTSGTVSAPITIGRYGTGINPQAGTGATFGLYIDARSNIRVSNFTIKGCTSYGVYIRGTGASTISNLSFTDVESSYNGRSGFYADSIVLDCTLQNITYIRCVAIDNGEHGFDNLGIVRNVVHINCYARGNGELILGHGFSIHPFQAANATPIWDQTGGETGNVYGRLLSANESVQKVLNRTDGVILTQNAGAGLGITLNQWDQTGTRLRVNVGANPNTKTMSFKRAPHGPFYYYGCVAEYNSTKAGPGEGHGFGSDDMTGPSYFYSCLSMYNEGAGFQFQWSVDSGVYGCVAMYNALSNFRTTGYTERVTMSQNTSLYAKQHGFIFDSPMISSTLQNNISAFNGTNSSAFFGMVAVGAGCTASNNCVFGNGSTGTNNTSNVTNTNGLTQNPRVQSDFSVANPNLYSAGASIGGVDYYRKELKNSPTIGAVQYFPPRPIRT